MKEIKVTVKLTVYSDDRDEELLNEAVYAGLMDAMEAQDLKYTYKVIDEEADEEEEMEELV